MQLNKFLFFTWMVIIYTGTKNTCLAQAPAKPIYVIVHGAWGGSWAFKKVDSLLSEQGAIVYRPSLTGQGERVHLATPEIGLYTHIKDVVNMILYEDLEDIILVGHSYGGMVVTGVADSLAGRIKHLVYLDAFLPDHGESAISLWGAGADQIKNMAPTGFLIPQWVPADKLPPKDVPHPLKTLTDTLLLSNPLRSNIPTTYIFTVEKNTKPESDDFAAQAERARKKGWPVLILEADHNPQWSAPERLVEMIQWIGKK
jgi:pimeloyl-ACP methyl ester carboxylesterase